MEESGISQGMRVIKKSQIHAPGSPASAPSCGLPSVQLREEGGKPRFLEVHCACGGKISIELEFGSVAREEGKS